MSTAKLLSLARLSPISTSRRSGRIPAPFAAALLALMPGCGSPAAPRGNAEQPAQVAARQPPAATSRVERQKASAAAPPEAVSGGDASPELEQQPSAERSSLAPLISMPDSPAPAEPAEPAAAPEIDEARVEQQGIRKLSGKRLTLYTDLPLDDEIKSLTDAFDQAYPQWLEYFALPQDTQPAWRAIGRLMKDEAKFRAAGLLPDDLPPFANGYTLGDHFWWREQASAYYRRHLLLHEGTHAFMFNRFGTCGPPWYMEGVAELLATHDWNDGRLKLNVFPSRREEVPYWGRIKMVRDAVKANNAVSLQQVLAFEPGERTIAEPYGWCWATAAFLDGHPRYQKRFRQMPGELKTRDFNLRLEELFADDWLHLNEEWQCYIFNLEYGYDLVRNAIDFRPGQALPAAGAQFTLASDRGWQSTGIRLEANQTYSLRASGRYQLGQQPHVWWCEPNGVTIRYYGGRPLGVLLAAVHPDPYDPTAVSSLLSPIVVALRTSLTPSESGTLYLRINDSPAELSDNIGTIEVQIAAE